MDKINGKDWFTLEEGKPVEKNGHSIKILALDWDGNVILTWYHPERDITDSRGRTYVKPPAFGQNTKLNNIAYWSYVPWYPVDFKNKKEKYLR